MNMSIAPGYVKGYTLMKPDRPHWWPAFLRRWFPAKRSPFNSIMLLAGPTKMIDALPARNGVLKTKGGERHAANRRIALPDGNSVDIMLVRDMTHIDFDSEKSTILNSARIVPFVHKNLD